MVNDTLVRGEESLHTFAVRLRAAVCSNEAQLVPQVEYIFMQKKSFWATQRVTFGVGNPVFYPC